MNDVKTDANININQRIEYDSELFKAESQKDLCEILIDLVSKDGFELIPANIGLEDISLNNFIFIIIYWFQTELGCFQVQVQRILFWLI